jgi:hypothetical protein
LKSFGGKIIFCVPLRDGNFIQFSSDLIDLMREMLVIFVIINVFGWYKVALCTVNDKNKNLQLIH